MQPLKVYACYNTNLEIRMSSSSGAIFTALAEAVLEQNGVVYGVAMTEDCYAAKFIRVEDKSSLNKLRGSKYLQAKVGDTYKKVKKDLLAGKQVLFSGTGCQVNGLKNFLGKNYENLLCVDVICHGAPSPALWRKYAEYQEEKHGGKLKYINFRCKDDSWEDFGMKEVIAEIPDNAVKKLYISKDKDPYMQMFLRDYCLRPSCYACVAKKVKKSDLTIADFWGIDGVASEMNDGNGTSLVLIRTVKGQELFNKISESMKVKQVDYDKAVLCNPAEYKSCARPMQRETFFKDMHSISFEELEKKYAAPLKYPLIVRMKIFAKRIIKGLIKIIGGIKLSKDMNYSLCFIIDSRGEN